MKKSPVSADLSSVLNDHKGLQNHVATHNNNTIIVVYINRMYKELMGELSLIDSDIKTVFWGMQNYGSHFCPGFRVCVNLRNLL